MIRELERLFDKSWLDRHIRAMYRLERKQTFPAWNASAEYAYHLLQEEGFEAELIPFPADGVTTYQDKRTPIGWDCTNMTLKLVTPVNGISDPVIADYQREPLHAVKHSVSTPPGGITTRVVTENQMKAGVDVKGAFVLLNLTTRPRLAAMRALLDLGAIGWISDFIENPLADPNCVAWINAGCERNGWHVQADDRDYISYQITPKDGMNLRKACENGTVLVHAESDGRRYESVLPAVTAVLPGESKREIWLNAHLYEPLIDDNSNGVVGSIAILKALRELAQSGQIHLKYSVRVVFASEMYGFAAFADHYGDTRDVLGAIVMDGIMSSTDKSRVHDYRCIEAIDYHGDSRADGFAGNIFLAATADEITREYPDYILHRQTHTLGDDQCLGDSTNGVRTIWIIHGSQGYHHNSLQNEDSIDIDMTAIHLSYCAEWVRQMAAMSAEELKAILPIAAKRAQQILDNAVSAPARPGSDTAARMEYLYARECARLNDLKVYCNLPEIDEAIRSLKKPTAAPAPASEAVPVRPDYARALPMSWFDYADNFIFTRLTRGFPHDLVKLPQSQRVEMPGTILYDSLADIVSRMTPGVTFKQILQEVEWDKGVIFADSMIRTYLHTCTMLADAGYLALEQKNAESADSLAEALKKLGVQEGETVVVHTALSGLGYVPGGTDTILEGLRKAVGENGTLMAPIFARPYTAFEGTINKGLNYRPYDTRPDGELRDASIWTGALPKAMCKEPDAARSGHATHEFVAIGKDADKLVAGHGLLDPPTGITSPFTEALKRHGSIVFLGCSISSNTFLHYVEDCADAPFLQPAVINYIDAEGETRMALIPRHLPGDRDFYHDPAKSEFYKEAVARGLHIHAVPFGMATLYRMEMDELYDISMQMFREDPCATLCHSETCDYCTKYRTKYAKR